MNRRLANSVWPCIAILGLALPALAENQAAIPLVPAGDWHALSLHPADVKEVSQFGGNPAIEAEYGVDSLELGAYQLGRMTVQTCIESSPDASTAFGLFTFYRKNSMTPIPGIPLSATGREGTLMAYGRYFLRVAPPAETVHEMADNELRALLYLLAHQQPPGENALNLPVTLPRKELLPGTEKYFLGEIAFHGDFPTFPADLIGFAQGAEVQTGEYSVPQGRATVMAISYPTPQIARAQFGGMEKSLGINQTNGGSGVFGKRMGSYIITVVGANSSEAASGLLDRFGHSARVVVEEPTLRGESAAVQFARFIIGNFIFIAILFAVAVGGGILIFLLKQAARRWFPDTEWGQPDYTSLITLNLK